MFADFSKEGQDELLGELDELEGLAMEDEMEMMPKCLNVPLAAAPISIVPPIND